MKMKLMLIPLVALIAACSSGSNNFMLVPIPSEGLCGLNKRLDNNGNPFYIGACANESVLIQWTQEGQEWRAIRKKNGDYVFYLKDEKGVFQYFDPKAGMPPRLPQADLTV